MSCLLHSKSHAYWSRCVSGHRDVCIWLSEAHSSKRHISRMNYPDTWSKVISLKQNSLNQLENKIYEPDTLMIGIWLNLEPSGFWFSLIWIHLYRLFPLLFINLCDAMGLNYRTVFWCLIWCYFACKTLVILKAHLVCQARHCSD